MSTILDLPPEILEDIFLRLDDAADVARASAACRSHRSVVSNRRFLRRYRFLHPPPVLGFLLESMGNAGFLHAEAPHKSAPAASSLAQAADFSFSFLPLPMDPNTNYGSRSWRVCDARDGRVLLSRRSAKNSATFLDLVICDPLYRRYDEIPPIPEDLWAKRYSTEMKSEPFLLPAREEEEESQFRVIYNWVCRYKIITFLFNSDTRKWSVATSFSLLLPERLIYDPMDFLRHYVGSCFYWVHHRVPNYMIVLDLLEMEFSITGLPYGTDDDMLGLAVVDAGVNRLGIIGLGYVGNLDLHSKTWETNGGSTEEWRHDKHHTLPEGYKHCHIIGASEGCLVLVDYSMQIAQYFIMDPKTFLVERFCKGKLLHAVDHALPYARFPPSLSPPSI
jgi:hypothetical protein